MRASVPVVLLLFLALATTASAAGDPRTEGANSDGAVSSVLDTVKHVLTDVRDIATDAQSGAAPLLPDLGITATPISALEQGGSAQAKPSSKGEITPALLVEEGGSIALVTLLLAFSAWATTKWAWTTAAGRRLLGAAIVLPLALFSRIRSSDLLENPVRNGMLTFIHSNPGASLRDAQQAAGVAWGTAVYHLRRLEGDGQVVSLREGGYRRYWQANTAESAHRKATTELASATTRSLARALLAGPGQAQIELAAASGLSTATTSRQLRRLEAAGLVSSTSKGRTVIYEANDKLATMLADADKALPLAEVTRVVPAANFTEMMKVTEVATVSA